MERRLSAILAADMVGYSRLMEADEIGVLERQKIHRNEVMDPAIKKYRGRIVKEMGDGILVEFSSVIQAVQCAVDVQRVLQEREAGEPRERRIDYRIGINLGDIVLENDDIFGDGVNIAARLEQIADAGGVCISGSAYDQMKSTVQVGYESLGNVQVKNIGRPIRAYRVLLDPDQAGVNLQKQGFRLELRVFTAVFALLCIAIGAGFWFWQSQPDFTPADTTKFALKLPDKPSIVILPFANHSGDESKDWIGDGLTESIISTLSVSPEMLVMGRVTAFSYKGKTVIVRDVAQELGVRYVLTGSVQSVANKMRVTAELSDAIKGKVLWSVREDGTTNDLFKFQDDIAQKLFVELQIALTVGETSRTWLALAGSFETFSKMIEGRVEFQKFSPDGHRRAQEIWSEIQKKKPESPVGHYLMGYIAWQRVIIGISKDPVADFNEARKLASAALALHEFGDAYTLLAVIEGHSQNYDAAIKMAENAIKLAPGSADANAIGGNAMYDSGSAEQGLEYMLKGMRLEPDFPEWLAKAIYPALLEQGRYEEVISLAQSVLAADTKDPRSRPAAHVALIVALTLHGKLVTAQKMAQDVMKKAPNLTSDSLASVTFANHKPRPFHEVFKNSLRSAGFPREG